MKYSIYRNTTAIKWIIAILGILIGGTSVIYTNILVRRLADREKRQVDFFAKAQARMASLSEDNPDVTFLLTEVLQANDLIPVVLLDGNKHPISSRNIEIPEELEGVSKDSFLLEMVDLMEQEYPPIVIEIAPDVHNYIYYTNSTLVKELRFAPVIQLSVLGVLFIIAYMIFRSSKRAEQNQVWAGLAKETAHQLGTPISSLMAWIEYFKTDESFDQEIITELEKDISRLEMITARFSSIGSVPQLQRADLNIAVRRAVSYLSKRISSKVIMSVKSYDEGLNAKVSAPLFEWVIENLCKNAVDAMNSQGHIDIELSLSKDSKMVVIDVTDDGKGISKSKIKTVFKPGFTTKKRGWGLGLTLAKRIVEDYHGGKISVKRSAPGIGTTFRIVLPKDSGEVA
ncbi:HAMP domain-containing sensor histidine kinase [Limibacter armeniacum]|uniref:sensor histidine kinase n=1 Tax=Limibacter armeniacum TaxID=466084 RepID=UPI002FE59E5E